MPCGKLLSEAHMHFFPSQVSFTSTQIFVIYNRERVRLAMRCFSVLVEKCGCKCSPGCKQVAPFNDFLLSRQLINYKSAMSLWFMGNKIESLL